jgi:hypothetical protein
VTIRDELHAIAADAIKAAKGDKLRAAMRLMTTLRGRPDLLEALALDYLERVSADMMSEPSPAATKPRVAKVRAHERRTPSQRAAALRSRGEVAAAVLTAYDYKIDGRPIGDIRWGELQTLYEKKLNSGVSFLRLGTEEIAQFLLLGKMMRHCQVDDPSTFARNVLSIGVIENYIDESLIEVPNWISMGMDAVTEKFAEIQRKALAT